MPKTEEVEQNIKLKIIFKYKEISFEKNEAQLLNVNENIIKYNNCI